MPPRTDYGERDVTYQNRTNIVNYGAERDKVLRMRTRAARLAADRAVLVARGTENS